jgi:hypothetical protein
MSALRETVRDACVAALTSGDPLPLSPEVRGENEAANWVRHRAQTVPVVLVIGSQVRKRRVSRRDWQPEVDITVIVFAPANRADKERLDTLDELAEAIESRLRDARPDGFTSVDVVEGDPFDPNAVQGAKTYAHSFTITYRRGSL